MIFGGTDLNEHYKESTEFDIMTKAVNKAVYVQYYQLIILSFLILYSE